nr:MAG TPA: hypothetical protein [Caudoviricetes sp.]
MQKGNGIRKNLHYSAKLVGKMYKISTKMAVKM